MEHFEDLSAYFWTVCNLEFGFSPPVEGFSHCWPSCHKLGSLTVIQHPPRRVNVGENTRTHSCGEMWLRWGISWCGVAKHTHTHTRPEGTRDDRDFPNKCPVVSCRFITCTLFCVVTAHSLACSVSSCPLWAPNIWSLTHPLRFLLFSAVCLVVWSRPFLSPRRKRSLLAVASSLLFSGKVMHLLPGHIFNLLLKETNKQKSIVN